MERSLELDGLDRNIGLHLGIAHSQTVLTLDPKLKPLGLTAKLVTILWLTDANSEIHQVDIARFLKLKRSTIHQFIKALTNGGFLEYIPSPVDRRSKQLRLTRSGRTALERAREVVAHHEAQMNARLTPDEQQSLLALISKMRGVGDDMVESTLVPAS